MTAGGKGCLSAWFLAIAVSSAAQSGIDGTLVDGTNGGSGRADRVNLIRLADGMSQVASQDKVDGRFHFDISQPGPYLVQAQKGGVSYNQMVPPQERGIATPEITVFDTTTDLAAMTVGLHMVLIVDGPRVHVSRVYTVHNSTVPPRSIVGPKPGDGAFRFDVPDDAVSVSASITSSRMPLRQDPVETADGRGKTIAYGIKPGETRFEIDYEVPYNGAREFRETLYHGAVSLSVVVVPSDISVVSADLGTPEPQERQGVKFWVFTGTNLETGKVVGLSLTGEGVAPRAPDDAAAGSAGAADGAGAGGESMVGEVKEVLPASARGAVRPAILVVGGSILLAAMAMALRRPRPVQPGSEPQHRRTNAAAEALLDQVVALDREFAAGRMTEHEHLEQRSAVKRLLHHELDALRRKKKSA